MIKLPDTIKGLKTKIAEYKEVLKDHECIYGKKGCVCEKYRKELKTMEKRYDFLLDKMALAQNIN